MRDASASRSERPPNDAYASITQGTPPASRPPTTAARRRGRRHAAARTSSGIETHTASVGRIHAISAAPATTARSVPVDEGSRRWRRKAPAAISAPIATQ